MDLQITKQALNQAVQRIVGAVNEKTLTQIALRAHDNTLTLQAQDCTLAIYSHVPCEALAEGQSFVLARMFCDVLRQLPEATVRLHTEDSELVISVQADTDFTMRLNLIEGARWLPPFEFSPQAVVGTLKTELLSYMINQVLFCLAEESARSYGSVAYLHKPEPGKLCLVGTDGFRLSLCEVNLEDSQSFAHLEQAGICLAKRALLELLRMCHAGAESLTLRFDERNTLLLAFTENYEIYISLSALEFPNYAGVLPRKPPVQVSFNREVFQGVTKRALITADRTKALKLAFVPRSFSLSSQSAGRGQTLEKVAIEGYEGSERSVFLNGKFLIDICAASQSTEMIIKLPQGDQPVMLYPAEEPSHCKSRHVLVPIRQNSN